MVIRRFLLLVTFIVSYLGLQAQEYVMVWTKEGQQIAYKLKQRPKAFFTDESVKLTTDSIVADYYPLVNMHKITFEDTLPTPIDDGISIINNGKIQVGEEEIILIGFPDGTFVSLNAVDGRHSKKYKTNSRGNLRLGLSGLPSGVFIVKANKSTIKIMKK
ncbi:MAG: hypothetical protein J5867_05575 [Prevotella sp.]|nr:hypothetical protein [Prevotella sp.]